MFPNKPHGNLLRRIMDNPDIIASGLRVEIAGPRSVKICRNGSFLGVWRQALGSFDWYPAGYNQPMCRVPTPEEVARHLVRTLGSSQSQSV